jgi:hypothetical protein
MTGLDGGDSERAVRALTDRIATALRGLIVEAHDRQTLHLLRLADIVWQVESGEPAGTDAAEAARLRQILRASSYLAEREPARLDDVRRELERYERDLEAARLSVTAAGTAYAPGAVVRYALREGTALAFLLPIALWGIVLHGLPYRLTALAVTLSRPDPDVIATYKVLAGAILYPLCWAAETWAAWRLGGVPFMLLVAGTLVPAGALALAWQARLSRVGEDTRAFRHFLVDRDLHRRLRERRRALADELSRLARLVPESLLTGTGTAAGDTGEPRSAPPAGKTSR